jgi:hypothetical protein
LSTSSSRKTGLRELGAAQALDDPARHGAHVGAAMAADLRLVAHAAERRPHEVAPHGTGDRAPERGLADARRPDEAQDRALRLGRELAHREVLEDAVLHLLEVVVVVVEDPARLAQLELVLGLGGPRQVGDPLEVGADHVPVRRVLGQGGEPLELALGLHRGLGRQPGGLDALAQLVHLLRPGVALADLGLDVAQPPPQQPLAALRIELGGLRLRGELALVLGDRDLAIEVRLHAPSRTPSRPPRRAATICSSGASGSVDAIRSASRPGLGRPATNAFHSSGRSSRRSMMRCAFSITSFQAASRSGEGASTSASGSMRTRRQGSVAAGSRPRRVRATPTTIACLPSPRASMMRATRTMQATGQSSSTPGSSTSGSRWLAITRNPPWPASERAASDRDRPIASGRVTPGNTTASRTGRRGSTSGISSRSPPTPITVRRST